MLYELVMKVITLANILPIYRWQDKHSSNLHFKHMEFKTIISYIQKLPLNDSVEIISNLYSLWMGWIKRKNKFTFVVNITET